MIYSTTRCPSCGKIIRRQTNPVEKLGNPFERCRNCGKFYKNSYTEEWITKSPIKRFFFLLPIYTWARAFMFPMFIILIPSAILDIDIESIIILWPIMSITWLVGGYFLYKKAEKENIRKSIERTKDPEYLNLLRQAGYKIYPIKE